MRKRKSLLKRLEKIRLKGSYWDNIYINYNNKTFTFGDKYFTGYAISCLLKGTNTVPHFESNLNNLKEYTSLDFNKKKMKYSIRKITKQKVRGEEGFQTYIETLIKDTDKFATIVDNHIILSKEIVRLKKEFQACICEGCILLVSTKDKGKVIGEYKTMKEVKKVLILEEL